ncbi:hypothetical protein QTO34_015576 [Cnephaeus nilssonii]|uniref:Uncharacterized protein n=1 Tax=Cnephaeus nilssonii TaxID=3371016 RepID=A0AA40LT81_CNENI|nr:hypothetical protein QTO34_015576 [Eptesicus nilssonii]
MARTLSSRRQWRHEFSILGRRSEFGRTISIQEPAHIQESESPLASKDHSCHQNVDLFACNGLEPHMPTNVVSQSSASTIFEHKLFSH